MKYTVSDSIKLNFNVIYSSIYSKNSPSVLKHLNIFNNMLSFYTLTNKTIFPDDK